jgi:hypothetical protein
MSIGVWSTGLEWHSFLQLVLKAIPMSQQMPLPTNSKSLPESVGRHLKSKI